jgi:hypothetical protein
MLDPAEEGTRRRSRMRIPDSKKSPSAIANSLHATSVLIWYLFHVGLCGFKQFTVEMSFYCGVDESSQLPGGAIPCLAHRFNAVTETPTFWPYGKLIHEDKHYVQRIFIQRWRLHRP